MLCALIFITVFKVEIPGTVKAQVIEEWVARYDGPGNYNDYARAMTVDSEGNIYVTGKSADDGTRYDYTTIKYDSDGNQLWIARYDGFNFDDCPSSIALDLKGNVYVTGYSCAPDTDEDYATIKYDSSGNELWVARYDGPGDGWDWPHEIVLDKSANVYVTGYSAGVGTGSDYATIKYDTDGNELWVKRYDGSGHGWDQANGLAIDQSGNVFVTGSSFDGYHYLGNSSQDYATVAYDTFGNQLWVVRYSGPGNYSWDWAYDITVDSSGKVYVTGDSNMDYTTIAYDTSGNELWVASYDGPANFDDDARDMAIDTKGHIYVTGRSYGVDSYYDYATVAYDSNGTELWVRRYNGPGNWEDKAWALTVDSLGNIYVTGFSAQNPSYPDYNDDITTIKYDSLGNELWIARYNGPGNSTDSSRAINVDTFGNVYVCGKSYNTKGDFDFTTIKYSQQEQVLKATINIDPDTLNLKSKGRWITCYIDLPGYDVSAIDISTILLEDTIPAEWGDIMGDTLMVKFDRSDVEDMLMPGTYILKVTGELLDGTGFEGFSDEVRVIDPGK
jgi:uncharacterized delta-60 repeat protein